MSLGKTRFTWNPQVNLKNGFSEESIIDDASGLLTGVIYVVFASLLGLNGWLGLAVSVGLPYLAGKIFKAPGMCSAALGIGMAHVLMAKAGDSVANMLGKPIWTLNTKEDAAKDAADKTTTTVPDMNAVQTIEREGVSDIINLPNGERIVAFSPDEIDRISVPINDNLSDKSLSDVVSPNQNPTPWNGQIVQKPMRRRTFGYLNAA